MAANQSILSLYSIVRKENVPLKYIKSVQGGKAESYIAKIKDDIKNNMN